MIPKAAVWLFFVVERVLTTQVPLVPPGYADLGPWNLNEQPTLNATDNLVFDTANSLLQHWANTRYRNGMCNLQD
jgi:hypothetical protein